MNLRKGFFRLAIFVSVIVTAVSFYFFWRVFTPWYYSQRGMSHYLDYSQLGEVIGRSLICGGAVWVIYFSAKFVVEGFVGGKESQK